MSEILPVYQTEPRGEAVQRPVPTPSVEHTPGPWEVRFSQSGYPYQICAPDQSDQVAGRVGTCITRWASISLPSSAEGLANARLIAASPWLLAECKAAKRALEAIFDSGVEWYDNKQGDMVSVEGLIGSLDAVIEKATKEQA